MSRLLARSLSLALLVSLPALALAACGNASTAGTTPGGDTAGVFSDHIDVGGMSSQTGALTNQFSPVSQGVQAYFKMVNANGGVNGRKLNYVANLDDQQSASLDVTQAQALVNQYHVFAAVGVAVIDFTGGVYLGQNNIPTFGYNINPQWSPYPSLFGQNGSHNNYLHPGPFLSWLSQHVINTNKVGVFAYSISQSAQCAQGFKNTLSQFGSQVVIDDSSLPPGVTSNDVAGDIQRLKSSGAKFIGTCMDIGGNKAISQGLQEAGAYNGVAQEWANGGDQVTLQANAPSMEGVFFVTEAGNVPFFHGYTKGMDQYLDAMAANNYPVGDVTLAGWLNAQLFASGLQQLGRNVTRSGLVHVLNNMTDWTGNHILAGVDWKTQHTGNGPVDCNANYQVQHGTFVPVLGQGKDPYVCFAAPNATTNNPVPFPGGSAGESAFFDSPLTPPAPAKPILPS